jgi:outer membrane protein assembly factor BamD (BamD/ComL family)
MQAIMNPIGRLAAVAVLALAVAGCGGKRTSAKAVAEQLQQSFEKADAPVKQEVAQASAALQAGQYVQALRTLDRVAQTQPVNEAQKQAVGLLIQQTQQAVRQNPKLNSPELYKAMSDLVTRVHGEN